MVDALSDENDKIQHFMSVDKNQNGFLDLTEISSYMNRKLESGKITEESLESLLRQNQFDVDFLGQDNQMDFKEWRRFFWLTEAKCSKAVPTKPTSVVIEMLQKL